MEKTELLKLFDQELRQNTHFPGTRREVSDTIIRVVIPDEHFGFIPYSALDDQTVHAEIERQLAFFKNQQMGFEWKVYDHDRPANLRDCLKARGFEIEDPEALMVMDLKEAPEVYWTMDLSPITRVTGPEDLEDIIRMETEVWGDDHSWMHVRLGKDLLENPNLLSVYTVVADGRVVSAAWTYYEPPSQFAGLWGGSTLPAYRKRGYYTALIAARAREARERGYRFLMVDASPMSRPILERHGFQFLGYSTPCKWHPQPKKEESVV